MTNSTHPHRSDKIKKPHAAFPLTPHPSGRWCKKIKGRLHYFGKAVADDAGASAQAALERWLAEKDDLLAGRVPRARQQDGFTLAELVNLFLTRKATRRDLGKLSPYTWQSYYEVCAELVSEFGRDRVVMDLRPDDFERLYVRWAKKWGVERLASEIGRARTVFTFAWKNDKIPTPIRFGDGFSRPARRELMANKHERGPKTFTAEELRRMIDAAGQPLKTMLLLAINGAMGNNDVAQMPLTALDLEAGWLNYPRPKTAIMRRVPLWKETIAAIREWLCVKPEAKDEKNAKLVFLTVRGDGWGTNIKDRPITHECRKLLDKLAISGARNFYCVRHCFETIAGDSRDQIAVDAIMGHHDGSQAMRYREGISDDRLQAVVEHVRRWLYPPPPAPEKKKREPKTIAPPDEAAREWQALYDGAIALGDYAEIDRRNRTILDPLTRAQLQAVAALVNYSCRASDTKSNVIDGMSRRIKERLGSHQRNQFRTDGGVK
jgi:integrase